MKPHTTSGLHARSEHERPTPKLMFFGAPHGDFKPVIAAVERFRPEAIVLLGDCGVSVKRNVSQPRAITSDEKPVRTVFAFVPGVNYPERRIDSLDLLPELTCCLT